MLQNAALNLFNSMSDKKYMQIQDEKNVYVAFLLKTSFWFFYHLTYQHTSFSGWQPIPG